MSDKRKWVPEIMYEEYEEDSISGGLPFIQVPEDKEMPDILFMFGSQETGEFEPDASGEPQPIMEMELFQYACMQYLKEELDETTYDKVRVCLGLQPLNQAVKAGMKQSEKILNKFN
tara:strand:+ start:69 stop:419 length:351 start_codon:yes stop_codon:yes gene_type:complete